MLVSSVVSGVISGLLTINDRISKGSKDQRSILLWSEHGPQLLCYADGCLFRNKSGFGVSRTSHRKQDSLAVFLLADCDIFANVWTINQLGAVEEGAIVLLIGKVQDRLASEARDDLIEES